MPAIGSHVGRIRLEAVLGRGGMGDVYAGFDETLGRLVAVKSIRSDRRLTTEAKARFLREARVLSQLDHPNICRIYDFIESDEGHFLVLELVRGRTLGDVIRDGCSRSEALRIAEQLCEVLAAAHRAGVVHRDLKPGNVMLTVEGNVKVLDFGLARPIELPAAPPDEGSRAAPGPAYDRSLFVETIRPEEEDESAPSTDVGSSQGSADPTRRSRLLQPGPISDSDLRAGLETRHGAVVGTPKYMSPEQARGEPVASASDMYSLGLVLQTLFTGRRPYPEGLAHERLIELVRRAESDPPEGLPSDLERLIQRLKSPSPADRPTALETRERLREIRDKPKRRLRWAAAVVLMLLAVAAGLKYTFDLQAERELAQQRRAEAEDLLDFMVDELRDRLEPIGRLDILADVTDKALEHSAAVGEHVDDEDRLRRSRVLLQSGEINYERGDMAAAERAFGEALGLAGPLAESAPDDAGRLVHLGAVHYWIGAVRRKQGDLEDARREFETYLGIAERLTELEPGNEQWQVELGYAHSNMGSILLDFGEPEAALEQFRVTAAIDGQRVAADPTSASRRRDQAETLSWLGEAHLARGDLRAARESYARYQEVMESLVARDASNSGWLMLLGMSHGKLADVHHLLGDGEMSRRHAEQGLAIFETLTEQDPTNSSWQSELSGQLWRVGRERAEEGDATGIDLMVRARDLRAGLIAEHGSGAGFEPQQVAVLVDLGAAELRRGDREEAERLAREALLLAVELETALVRSPDLLERHAAALMLLGAAVAPETTGRGRSYFEEALARLASAAPGSLTVESRALMAQALLRLGRLDEARPVLARLEKEGYRGRALVSLCRRLGVPYGNPAQHTSS